jgi:hypothetical protein
VSQPFPFYRSPHVSLCPSPRRRVAASPRSPTLEWITQPPDPSTISAYNRFLLAFWVPTGPLDDAQGWQELDASTRTSILNEYHAAGIALMVSAFGSTCELHLRNAEARTKNLMLVPSSHPY